MITVESQLTKNQFMRLSILRHIQRTTFYFFAFTCAILTAYAIVLGPQSLLLVAWLPFILYIFMGFMNAYQGSQADGAPYFLSTRYEFAKSGVRLSAKSGKSRLKWEEIAAWKKMVGCYVLVLEGDAIVAIPEKDVPPSQSKQLEKVFNEYIGKAS